MPYDLGRSPHEQSLIDRFGMEFRRCRSLTGMTQAELGERVSVAQSTISRLENGLAPGISFITLLRLSDRMRGYFPLGHCPHQHDCVFQPLKPPRPASELDLGESGDPWWMAALKAMK